MLPCSTRKRMIFLMALVWHIFLISLFCYHGFQNSTFRSLQQILWSENNEEEGTGEIQSESKQQANERKIKDMFNQIDQQIPRTTFMHMNYSTSAQESRATIVNRKDMYCVGDDLTVQLDMYDHMGTRKKYGGDFLRARIYSPDLKAGASGKIEDFNNGTYHVHFTFFWAGRVQFSLMLFHPSEGVSALWRARNQGYENMYFTGVFTSTPKDIQTECGLYINTTEELCKYQDDRDKEYFYCVKPQNVSCAAFAFLKSSVRQHSYLSNLEKSLFIRSNIGLEITRSFEHITVLQCNKSITTSKEKCRIGMRSKFPSGYFYQNLWNPLFCQITRFEPGDQLNVCLEGKMIHLMGDSTLRQWILYFPKLVKTLKFFNLHGIGIHRKQLALDMDRNLQIQWKKHGHPFVSQHFFAVKDVAYVTREIDQLAGGNYTVVVITLGQHFRLFPMQVFIRRAINVRGAVERLLLRSPDTKVIIKSENNREMTVDMERFSDFHGYVQYRALKDIFQDLNVGVIDAWDMTTALATNNAHPPDEVIANQLNMFLTYIC